MLLKKLIIAVVVVLSSGVAVAAVDPADDVRLAEKRVNEYRSLRRACVITKGAQRRECFAQLNAATQGYKRAKKVLAIHQPSNEFPLIGQAR